MLEYANIRSGTALVRPARRQRARPSRTTCDVVPGQRDGRPVAARPQHGRGVRPARREDRAAPCGRSTPTSSSSSCGSSGAQMPTFGDWERTVLEETYDDVDYISCHAYYEPNDGDLGSFLASAVDMDRFIDSVVATADHVKALRAQRQDDQHLVRRVERLVPVALQRRRQDHRRRTSWPVAPRLLEDSYSVAGRGRGRQPAHLAAAARRPRDVGEPRPARQRHRADHDRAGRPGLAPDDVLPLRAHLARSPAGERSN